ncbi:homocysteine-responsive endoplasmic reticulum-resident ubiquitin-like domain member 2 protein isoform X2 [Phyllopteryx taeniolatus]|uniref:homocysteine-responsive endoplasmic reticulum-resident ubiquitin-like domain member 2 protein isoform X2 n=1 Tax=Phyllopteryx taeniolatus TaxID=161469 RepID=UPI002AD3F037|nr:homocysteine-responsive endoplasmic reticulum-resident ubiquitin-like domain member 2 protein isoform X2 [Phyllopteryx taeniolatus]
MESGAADTPVTLVIKAPDQKYEDRTINCFLSWTVEKLKRHMANVYPGKPRSRDQRLVYLGNLLEDHLRLQDVLRQHDEYHVLHLVCNFCTPPGSPAPCSASTVNAGSSKTAISTLPDIPAVPGGPDGLRHRGGILNLNPRRPAGIFITRPHGGAQMLTPMQMLWWQQMYARYYYMQYQAVVAASRPPTFPAATSQPPPPRPNETARPPLEPVRAADPLPENLVPPPAADANIQINAQAGGGVLNVDEPNRDWLDWLYALFRVCVLLSFVYFYSTFGRFVVVVGAMMLVYLHQVGRFPFRTLERQQRPPNFQDPEQAQAWEEAEERVMDDGMEEAEREDRGLLATAWSFVSTFFASLVPEGWPRRPPDLPPVLRPR